MWLRCSPSTGTDQAASPASRRVEPCTGESEEDGRRRIARKGGKEAPEKAVSQVQNLQCIVSEMFIGDIMKLMVGKSSISHLTVFHCLVDKQVRRISFEHSVTG